MREKRMDDARLLRRRGRLTVRRRGCWVPVLAMIGLLIVVGPVGAADSGKLRAPVAQEIVLAADNAKVWKEDRFRFLLLEGNCLIEQGLHRIRCEQCVAWIDDSIPPGQQIDVHLVAAGNVREEDGGRSPQRHTDFRKKLSTTSRVKLQVVEQVEASGANHPLYAEAVKMLPDVAPIGLTAEVEIVPATANVPFPENQQEVIAAQFVQTPPPVPDPVLGAPGEQDPAAGGIKTEQPVQIDPAGPLPTNLVPAAATATGRRRIRVSKRSSQPYQVDGFNTADGQQVWVFSGGVRVIVEAVDTGDVVSVVADRAVIWTRGDLKGQLDGEGTETEKEQPIEIYLEGNVFVRQGNLRSVQKSSTYVLSGKQVYYNVNTEKALVLDGSVETYDDQYRTPLIMTAAEIRQLTSTTFYADRAGFTTSPYRGTPGYEFTANQAFLEEVKQPVTNPFTGQQVIDSQTGEPLIRTRHFATGYSNVLRVSDVPLFYWPYIRADVQDPLGPLEDFQIGNTNNLGFSTSVVLDAWQLFGLDYLPIADRSNWLVDLGYHSKRGVAGGSRFDYFGTDLFNLSGQHYGRILTWGILDEGVDYLGMNRQGIAPPRDTRGRFLLQHRHDLPHDLTFIAEFSHLSDSNLLESFFEAEYDSGKDQDTLLYLKQARDHWAWTALVQPRVNDFLPQNPWYPRLDAYLQGVPLLGNRLTYFQHSSVGYGSLRPPKQYTLPTDQVIDLARFDTRHEIDYPLAIGPWQVTPFAIGQFTAYSDAPQANGLGRLYGAGGIRTSLPFWKLYPGVESSYLNLSGLAHKVSLTADYFYARSNRDFTEVPFMDQLDDDTSELVRRQNLLRQYAGDFPIRYDPRFIALRQNLGYYPEILDDMHNLRFGIQQRLQTKRGPIGNQHIIDWMSFDMGATMFPESDRDNLGELFGLIDYNYEWHIGDRTTFTSTMLHEPFDQTLAATSALYIQRPPRQLLGLFYSHYTTGPFESNYVGISSSYRFSRKYAGSIQTGVDLEATDNVSYQLNFTRIGLDFLVTVGIVYNAGRDDFGFQFNIVPRVQARTTFNRSLMRTLPFGVEPSESPVLNTEDRLSILNNTFNTF